jgi:septum formation protein
VTGYPEIILASASPRRKELLARLGLAFRVVESGLDEAPWPGEKPASYALRNALDKARAVAAREVPSSDTPTPPYPDTPIRIILSADTIVVLGDRILEKPRDAADARAMLRDLSGREHEVVTGVCLLAEGREIGVVSRSTVRFRDLADAEIAAYVATGEPMDKAGAYAIQGGAAPFVAATRGSYTNIVGLPMEDLERLLKMLGTPRD